MTTNEALEALYRKGKEAANYMMRELNFSDMDTAEGHKGGTAAHAELLDVLDRLAQGALTAAPVAEGVAVPQSALDWLNGSGPDANGQWFHETQDEIETYNKAFNRKTGQYWWRREFMSRMKALTPPATTKEQPQNSHNLSCADKGE